MRELVLPTIAELGALVPVLLEATGVLEPRPFMNKRQLRVGVPRKVYVGRKLRSARGNIDDDPKLFLKAFALKEWPYLERQILRSVYLERQILRSVLAGGEQPAHFDAPYAIPEEDIQSFFCDFSGRKAHHLSLNAPLLSHDRRRAYLAGCLAETESFEDVAFVLTRTGTQWKSKPWLT